ncbi:MAG: PIN domain-containing protein [Flavobacteriales bacterium]|nr:PIN domain-containing protein [Flavobacteriales bacterium]
MFLLDTNIIIYACRPQHEGLRDLIGQNASVVSVISKIEALGYHKLKMQEKLLLERLFQQFEIIDLTDEIASRAIKLRQKKRLSLGDAIIAATALENDLSLMTHNTVDFRNINELRLHDPIE